MIRRILAAIAAVALLPVLLAASASAAARSSELVASGTVVSATGKAMPGAVVDLRAWPSQAVLHKLKPGQAVPEILLATATAGTTGTYSLSVSPAALKGAANAAGYANLEVDSGTASWMFPVLAAQPVAVSVRLVSASPGYCSPNWNYHNGLHNSLGTVGQGFILNDGHTKGDTYKFHYGDSQSSALGVAISLGGASYGSFSDDGTTSITTSSGQGFQRQKKPSLVADRTIFANGLYYQECGPRAPAGTRREIPARGKWKAPKCPVQGGGAYCNWKAMSNDWVGGAYPKPVKSAPRATHCVAEPAGSAWHTTNAKAETIKGGFGIPEIGVTLTAQTGFSVTARQDYTFPSNSVLCGNTRPAHAASMWSSESLVVK